MSLCLDFNVLNLTNNHSQKYNLITMDDDPRASRMPSKLINFIDDYDKRHDYNNKSNSIDGHLDDVILDNEYSRRATIDRALDSFLSISDDMDYVISRASKTFAIELLGEKTLKAGKFGQPVINFYAPIKIGEPSKTYRIQFDLTTNDIFVPHYELMQQLRRKLGLQTILRNDQSYRCKKSDTGRKIDNKRQRGIDFHGLRFEGKMYEDSMQLSVLYQDSNSQTQKPTNTHLGLNDGQFSNISIFQHFVAVKNSVKQKSNLSKLPVHGYLGLGPRQRSPTGIKSFLLNLLDDDHIERLQFSLWFNKWTPSATLVLGGVQRDKFSDPIEWHRSDANEWSLEIERVELGRNLISNYRGFLPRASINLGVHEIYGPREAIKRIHHDLGVSKTTKLPLIDSTTITLLPSLVIYINDLAYKIEPRNYVRWCQKGAYVAILPSKNNRWVLGSVFLESRYTIFDVERLNIGFARLNETLRDGVITSNE